MTILAPILATSLASPVFTAVGERAKIGFPLMVFRCSDEKSKSGIKLSKVIIALNNKDQIRNNLFVLFSPQSNDPDFPTINSEISAYADHGREGGLASTTVKPDDKYGVQFTYTLHYRTDKVGPDLSVYDVTGTLSLTDGSVSRQCSLDYM